MASICGGLNVAKQWATLRRSRAWMMEAPQKCLLFSLVSRGETWWGYSPSVAVVPPATLGLKFWMNFEFTLQLLLAVAHYFRGLLLKRVSTAFNFWPRLLMQIIGFLVKVLEKNWRRRECVQKFIATPNILCFCTETSKYIHYQRLFNYPLLSCGSSRRQEPRSYWA